MMENETMTELFGDVISSYSRAQAIEDGVLIDVTKTAKEVGFNFPVAVTAGVWGVIEPDEESKSYGQDATGRLWDVLSILRMTIQGARGSSDRMPFSVLMSNGKRQRKVALNSVCGPGDDMEPVITIMLPDED